LQRKKQTRKYQNYSRLFINETHGITIITQAFPYFCAVKEPIKLVILISGKGSNARNLVNYFKDSYYFANSNQDYECFFTFPIYHHLLWDLIRGSKDCWKK